MTRLLKIAEEDAVQELDSYFEETERVSVEKVLPKVIDNQTSLGVGEHDLNSFDAVFADIPVKNAVFGRVLLEMIEEKDIALNYSSTAFFTMARKNYLFYVLNEKKVPTPKTAAIADEKAARKLQEHLKGPLEAKKIKKFKQTENTRIDSVEEIQGFAEGVEYGETIVIFQELSEGDKYKCFVAGDQVISLKDNSEGWEVSDESLSYTNISADLEDKVKRTAKILGTNVAEVILRDGEVADVKPNPDLEKFKKISGKSTYESVAEALKG